jgi:hypothetical protein
VAKLRRLVAKLGRRVAKLVSAPAYYGSSLGSNPDISQKYKMGDISKGVARPKNIHKNHKWLDVRRLIASIISAPWADRKGELQASPTAMLAD